MKIVQVLTRGDVLGGAQSHVREASACSAWPWSRGYGGPPVRQVCSLTSSSRGGYFLDADTSLVRPLRPHRDLAALIELWLVPAD